MWKRLNKIVCLNFQFILFASIIVAAAAYPGGYYSGHEIAALEGAHHDYGQIARGDDHEQHYEHHDEVVDYYVCWYLLSILIKNLYFC